MARLRRFLAALREWMAELMGEQVNMDDDDVRFLHIP